MRQVSVFSAYGLFSGNTASLQTVVQETQRALGVQAVLVFDADGTVLARSGISPLVRLADMQSASYLAHQQAQRIDVHTEKIMPALVPIDDLFSIEQQPPGVSAAPLGTAVVELSRQDLEIKKDSALLTALWVGSIGMLLGGLLAYQLGNWVVGPLVRVSQMVKRVGQGDFAIEDVVADSDPLKELQTSLNQMAKRLAWGREELERQVEQVTQELRRKMDQAETATQAKSRFLAAASHDLRQPSHALGMFVARLGQLPMEPHMRQLVDKLDIAVQSMQDLLDGLLDLSRLDAGNMQIRMAPVDLNALLASVQRALHGMAEAKGLRLRVRPTQRWCVSDAALLNRMLMNLVINAIRYTEHGSVLVACRPAARGTGVRLEVWDSGIGIAPEHHADIFKEFYQLNQRSGDRNLGMGLGLNIVQRSAELLGHQVALRSQPGQGTRFSIALQAASPAQIAAHRPTDAGLPAPGDITGLQVMLIDDNSNVREAVRELLASWGCVVRVATSLAEAQHLLQAHGAPDVILSDFHLGAAENGIDCIAALRAQAGSAIAACILSGDTHQDFLQAVKDAQLPLLHKPVRPAKLRSLLRRMLPGS